MGLLFLSVVGSTALVYALQTLYVNVDNKIVRGGTHAIRHRALLGLSWSVIHMPYHICLVLLATGLGILLRDVIIDPKAKTAEAAAYMLTVVRAGGSEAKGVSGPYFGNPQRLLFSVGWAGSLLLSAALSCMHKRSAQEATKILRLVVRGIVGLGLGIGMPFSEISAGGYLLVHAVVSAVLAIVEYFLVQVDVLDIVRRIKAARRADGLIQENVPDDSFDDSDEDVHSENELDEDRVAKREVQEAASPDPEAQLSRQRECKATRALKGRMKLHSRFRLEQVDPNRSRFKQCSAHAM